MNPLKTIDNFILGGFTKFAHAFQILTGKTNFFLAKIGTTMAALEVGIHAVNYFYPTLLGEKTNGLLFILYLWLLSILFRDTLNLDKAEKNASTSSEKVMIDRITNRGTPAYRLILVFLSLDATIRLVVSLLDKTTAHPIHTFTSPLFFYGLIIFYYFTAVDPLPPAKSKVRQWFEKLSLASAKPVEATTES